VSFGSPVVRFLLIALAILAALNVVVWTLL
jgi:hypothetical protein